MQGKPKYPQDELKSFSISACPFRVRFKTLKYAKGEKLNYKMSEIKQNDLILSLTPEKRL